MVKVGVMCSGVGTPFQNSAEKSRLKKNSAKKNRSEKNRLGKILGLDFDPTLTYTEYGLQDVEKRHTKCRVESGVSGPQIFLFDNSSWVV